MSSEDALRFPIGKFKAQDSYTAEEVAKNIARIESLPAKVEAAVKGMSTEQLDTPYRAGGWTIRQVIHHMADSHMNAFIRFKWTLTEDTPVIKAYDEKAWADTVETKADPVLSIALLKALHAKWIPLLNGLTTEDLKKEFTHPETKLNLSLARLTALYAWHGEHHLGHINIVAAK